jgi:membrane protein DedA with SNARE-associated domain
MSRFWVGFIVGALFQATIGAFIGMNISYACKQHGGCWFMYNSASPS